MATIKDGMITELDSGDVFVFGSNLAGRHGRGAARQALQWGAVYGVGRGLRGQTYALPTKSEDILTLPPYRIQYEIGRFSRFARYICPDLRFYLTAIGTGLAGLHESTVREWVEAADIPCNVVPWWTFEG